MSIDSAEKRSATARDQLGVPWSTVLPLAVALAYADGFWMTATRGAVGAIERTDEPFTTWWRESTVTLPIYVLAVLAALTLALRLFGPVLRNSKEVVLTALLVIGAGTAVGVSEVAASSVYDYYLQSDQLAMMDSMHGLCVGSCLEQAQASSFAALLRAVLYVAGLLAVTNLVLVGWLLAMRGGRIKVAATRQRADNALELESPTGGRVHNVRLLIVAGLLACAHIHAAVVPAQLTEWPAAALFFVLLTAVEIVVAAALLGRIGRGVLSATAAVSILPLVLWLFSHVTGLPFGPEAFVPEAVGLPDVLACLLEVVTLVGAIVLLRSTKRLAHRPSVSAHLQGLVLVAVIAVTAIGIAGAAPTWFDDPGTSGLDSVTATHH